MSYAPIERITKAYRTIETIHSYIHEGIFFEANIKVSAATAATNVIAIKTPILSGTTNMIPYANSVTMSTTTVTVTVVTATTYTLTCKTGTLTIVSGSTATVNVTATSVTFAVTTSAIVIVSTGSATYVQLEIGSTGTDWVSGGTTKILKGTKFLHMNPLKVATTADNVTITLHESQTVTTGTVVTLSNHNRMSTKTADTIILSSATATATGTAIHTIYIGGATGVGGTRSGGEVDLGNEWILKPGNTYLITITNGSANANTIFVSLNWYEEDGY